MTPAKNRYWDTFWCDHVYMFIIPIVYLLKGQLFRKIIVLLNLKILNTSFSKTYHCTYMYISCISCTKLSFVINSNVFTSSFYQWPWRKLSEHAVPSFVGHAYTEEWAMPRWWHVVCLCTLGYYNTAEQCSAVGLALHWACEAVLSQGWLATKLGLLCTSLYSAVVSLFSWV